MIGMCRINQFECFCLIFSTLEQADEQNVTIVIQVWKEVAFQTKSKKGLKPLKQKSMELFSMVELMEVFN